VDAAKTVRGRSYRDERLLEDWSPSSSCYVVKGVLSC
jgi:hypothetical protein